MLATKSIIALFFSLALSGTAKSVDPQPNYPEPEFVLRPDDVSMDEFEKQFLDLCPRYYGESEATDRPIFIFQTFQERFEKDIWHGHKAAVQCIYQVPTGEYWNIGASVATDLGGSALATLYDDAE
ncbi:hypothetical protein I204_06764 [Kwoniella mangroviensis CBS 8886]|uniref:uncharacterized protein n=1 Tax=Kwoniella mangroviensis CBS 8507 TaxID=1296122 RepID=UPI00080CDD98|nr:uncharacterized protein I203_01264 [Kwoniella mangroviensis CBS 8507]OCF69407.1 hypothetical protein I203_01264 [Kwoniella mangroviensis CBS 8507]OCF72385.1 hypothetical protein I204_06764 [Kwoniella mangroviensis CBS 8886]